jgi:hypothetical protein
LIQEPAAGGFFSASKKRAPLGSAGGKLGSSLWTSGNKKISPGGLDFIHRASTVSGDLVPRVQNALTQLTEKDFSVAGCYPQASSSSSCLYFLISLKMIGPLC